MPAQRPTNPRDMHDLCTRFVSRDDGMAHIYLLRYQTPEVLMSNIVRLINPVYNSLQNSFNLGNMGLVGLGYFQLSYTLDPTTSIPIFRALICDSASIPNTIASLEGGKPTLTSTQFLAAFNDVSHEGINFNQLVQTLIQKAFLESFIQSNFRVEVNFNIVISLDLYSNRQRGSNMIFHKDATPAFPTKFFTLTYVINGDPDTIMKGPTIVADNNGGKFRDLYDVRSAVTVAVRNGTTVGIDNTAVLHATPDDDVTMAMPDQIDPEERFIPIPPQTEPNLDFLMRRRIANSEYFGPELADDFDNRELQVANIRRATAAPTRSFLRAWYNSAGNPFPHDQAPTFQLIMDSNGPNMMNTIQFMRDIILEVRNTLFMDDIPLLPSEVVLGDSDFQKISLGGDKGRDVQKISEQKSKPSIGDVFASPKFQEKLNSTYDFVLGAGVKGKDATLLMGGKKSSWCKKRSMKCRKRSRTRRRMGGRKQKTRHNRR